MDAVNEISQLVSQVRRIRLEAALRIMITVWRQSTARTIRMHRIQLLSYRSHGIWCHTVIILRSAASSQMRLLSRLIAQSHMTFSMRMEEFIR